MGMFSRKRKYSLDPVTGPVTPGRELVVTVRMARMRDGDRVERLRPELTVQGRKESLGPVGEDLQATSVGTTIRFGRQEHEVGHAVSAPDDALATTLFVPWWCPVTRVGDHGLLGHASWPRVREDHYGCETPLEVVGTPVHGAVLAAAATMGWSYKRCELWDVGGTGRNVDQRIVYSPRDSVEAAGVKLAAVELVVVPTGADRGTVDATVVGRRLGVGLFPIGRATGVPVDAADPAALAAALRDRLAAVVATGSRPPGVTLDGPALETIVRALLP